jgi:hypothetical protein
MPSRRQKPSERLPHPTSTNKRNIVACNDRPHAVSPTREAKPLRHIVHGWRARGKLISPRWSLQGFDISHQDGTEAYHQGATGMELCKSATVFRL